MSKKTRNILAAILAVLMVLTLLLSLLPLRALAVTQEEVDILAVQRDAYRAQVAAIQAQIDELNAQKAETMELKRAMDERNTVIMQQLQLNEETIALYDEMIAEKEQEVLEARKAEADQLERYRGRVRSMEENGTLDLLALLINTTSLAQLLTAMDDVGEIMRRDREVEDAYIAAREHTQEVQAEYESLKAEVEVNQQELREEQVELKRQMDEATELIERLIAEAEEHQAEIEEIRAQEAETQKEINALVAELERQRAEEEARRRAAEGGGNSGSSGGSTGGSSGGSESSGGTVTGTGSFAWPVPSCTYVTSRAGNRYHPIFNEWRYHSGMDIGAGYGASVVASDGGTVCWCGEKGGYGNCIMIDHGNGYYTLYGHLSSYAVSYGSTVSQGQTIAYVGATGWATGPHLHFEIRYGDTILDPEATAGFSGLTYAPDAGN